MTVLYPTFLNLAARRCVVVGGGPVAERKARGLIAADADVILVALRTTPEIDRLDAEGALHVARRAYAPGDVVGAALVVAATDNSSVNAGIAADARANGALVNVVDDPAACDVVVPAVVRRGDVTLAVSTGGRSPSFARALREELDAWLSADRIALLDLLADVRVELKATGTNPGPQEWRDAIASPILLERLSAGDPAGARAALLSSLGVPINSSAIAATAVAPKHPTPLAPRNASLRHFS